MSPSEADLNSNKKARPTSRRKENLALLYQGLLTGIVRMQAGRQHVTDADSFRARTKSALKDVEREAIASGYDGADIAETHFAVVAFLDSVVFQSNEPIRAEWERKTLQEELFGQTDAGVTFFEKVDRLRSRRDSQDLADILEVFLLCILLGFEGRYSGGLRGELYAFEEKLRARIEDIRGKSRRLSPAGLPAPAPEILGVARTAGRKRSPYPFVLGLAILVTLLCFLATNLQLMSASSHLSRLLAYGL